MIRASKSYIACVLSFLIFTSMLHADRAYQINDSYGMCDVDCCDEKHRSKNHLIKDSINDNTRWFIELSVDFSSEVFQTKLSFADELYHNSNSNYELYSRPPPK